MKEGKEINSRIQNDGNQNKQRKRRKGKQINARNQNDGNSKQTTKMKEGKANQCKKSK